MRKEAAPAAHAPCCHPHCILGGCSRGLRLLRDKGNRLRGNVGLSVRRRCHHRRCLAHCPAQVRARALPRKDGAGRGSPARPDSPGPSSSAPRTPSPNTAPAVAALGSTLTLPLCPCCFPPVRPSLLTCPNRLTALHCLLWLTSPHPNSLRTASVPPDPPLPRNPYYPPLSPNAFLFTSLGPFPAAFCLVPLTVGLDLGGILASAISAGLASLLGFWGWRGRHL